MKSLKLLGLWLVLSVAALCQNSSLTGKFEFPDGSSLTGYMTLQIARPSVVNTCVSPVLVTSMQTVRIQVTAGVPATNSVLSTDCMSPKLPYLMSLYQADGTLIYQDNWYVPNTNGGSINIGLFMETALTATGISVAVPQPIVSTPIGNQTITQPVGTALSINNLIITGQCTGCTSTNFTNIANTWQQLQTFDNGLLLANSTQISWLTTASQPCPMLSVDNSNNYNIGDLGNCFGGSLQIWNQGAVIATASSSGIILEPGMGLYIGTSGVLALPSTLEGFVGTNGAYIQMSDGTSAPGDCPVYGADGSLHDSGAACGSGGGGGGTGNMQMTGAVVYFLPVVSNTTQPTLINSSISDNGTVAGTTEPWQVTNNIGVLTTCVASGGTNCGSNQLNFQISYGSGTSAQVSQYVYTGTGSTPGVTFNIKGPAGLPSFTTLIAIDPGLTASPSINYSTSKMDLRGAIDTSSGSTLLDCYMQGVPAASGENPAIALNINCSQGAGTGLVTLNVPGIALSGPPMIESQTASNSDFDGELYFGGVSSIPYTFVNPWVNHPECTFTPEFNTSTNNYWVTYSNSGTTWTMTLHFASALTGSVGYICGGRI